MFDGPEGGKHRALAVVATGNFVQLGTRLLVGAVVPLVLVEFETTKSAVGVALTGMWALYALLQFPSGALADRYGERRLLTAGVAGTAVGAALVAVAPSLPSFVVAVLALGAGAGLFFSPASSFVARSFDNTGVALGTLTAGSALAGIVYPSMAGVVGVRAGWRSAVAVGAVVAVPVLAATWRTMPSPPPSNPDRRVTDAVDYERVYGLLTRPRIAYTTLLAVLVGFTFQAFASFFPTFLVEYRSLEPGTAGLVFAAVFGISAVAQPLAGRLSDWTSRDLAIATSVTLAGTGLSVLLLVSGPDGLVAGSVVLASGLSWPGPVQARIMDQLSDAECGYAFGLVRTVYTLLGASGSAVVGTAAAVGGWRVGYAIPVAVLATCLAALAVNHVADLEL